MMKFLVNNVPEDGWVRNLGMAVDQKTVVGDSIHTYTGIEEATGVRVSKIFSNSPRVLLRACVLAWR